MASWTAWIDLVEWNRENACTVPDERLAKMMTDLTVFDNNSKVENHPDYWTMVLQQVMFANFDTAVTPLKFHSKYKDDDMCYRPIVSSLELIGLALARNETSTDEFVSISDVTFTNLEPLRSIVPTTYHDLKYLYSVLLGESQMFIDCCSKLDMKWYEILPAYLLFVHPKAGMRDLGQLAKMIVLLPDVMQQIENTFEPENSQDSCSDILEEVVVKKANKTLPNEMAVVQYNQTGDGVRPISDTFPDHVSSYTHVPPIYMPPTHVYYQPFAIPLAAPIYYPTIYNRPYYMRRFLCC